MSIESCYKEYKCEYSNFINTQSLQYSVVYLTESYMLSFSNCVFVNSHTIFSYYECNIYNCYSNTKIEGISTQFLPYESLFQIQGVICNEKYIFLTQAKSKSYFSIVLFVLLFIIIK